MAVVTTMSMQTSTSQRGHPWELQQGGPIETCSKKYSVVCAYRHGQLLPAKNKDSQVCEVISARRQRRGLLAEPTNNKTLQITNNAKSHKAEQELEWFPQPTAYPPQTCSHHCVAQQGRTFVQLLQQGDLNCEAGRWEMVVWHAQTESHTA